jgi:hypothetical protein
MIVYDPTTRALANEKADVLRRQLVNVNER